MSITLNPGTRYRVRLSDGSDLTGTLLRVDDHLLQITGAFHGGDTPVEYSVPWAAVVWIREVP